MDPDVYYVQGLWSLAFSIAPLLCIGLRLLPYRPVVVAVRGELGDAALAKSPRRKRVVGNALRWWYTRVLQTTWQATSQSEMERMLSWLPASSKDVVLAPNFGRAAEAEPTQAPSWTPGTALKIVIVGRVVPIKNIRVAIEALREVQQPVRADVYGTIEDRGYWRKCKSVAHSLPSRHSVAFQGVRDPAELLSVLRGSDIMFLPTQGENFGHAIGEAMSTGCPVLASDQTPWTNCLQEAGLRPGAPDDHSHYACELNRYGSMSVEERSLLRRRTLEAYRQRQRDGESAAMLLIEAFRRLGIGRVDGGVGH